MISCTAYQPSQLALPCHSSAYSQDPLSYSLPMAEQYSVASDVALTASTLAALQSIAAQNAYKVAPDNTSLTYNALDDLVDCVSDLSDLESCSFGEQTSPSMASVYEIGCALSPASSAESAFLADVGRTSPLHHYPHQPVPSATPPLAPAQPVVSSASCVSAVPVATAPVVDSCVADAVAQNIKPLLRKPIDVSKLNGLQVQRLLRRRERNKIAASKCRRKNKDKAVSIREELDQATSANEALRQEVKLLREEKEKLERILASHHCVLPDCGDSPAASPSSEAEEA